MALTSYILTNNRIDNLQISYANVQPTYNVQFSNNAIETNVLSNTEKNDITGVRIGQNIRALATSCFIGQTKLKEVNGASTSLVNIGDYAFKDCTSLTTISFLEKNTNNLFHSIGESAFANVGITSAYIGLSSSAFDTYIDSYAFASCTSLVHVENINHNYLADYEFAWCTALTSVVMPNKHSFAGEYTFKDCKSLVSVEIPANTFMLNTGLFYGCTSLTNVVFDESDSNPSQLKFSGSYGNDIFNGTAITSITFPKTLSNWSLFNNYALRGMDKLKVIRFKGMGVNDVCNTYQEKTVDYDTHYIYACKRVKDFGVFNKSDKKNYDKSYVKSNFFKQISVKEANDLMSLCIQTNIPIVNFISDETTECDHCVKFAKNIIGNKTFLDWVKNTNDKCIIVYGNSQDNLSYRKYIQKSKNGSWTYVIGLLFWKKADQSSPVTAGSTEIESMGAQGIIDLINKTFKDFEGTSTVKYTIETDLYRLRMFGLNHDVQIFVNDLSTSIDYVDGGIDFTPSLVYQQSIQTDIRTVDDFRYGQWYYNAKELKQFADENHIPVFLETGSKNCGPCEDFQLNVFNDTRFQSLLLSKKILLCRVSRKSNFSSGQEYFTKEEWIDTSDIPPGIMPILMFYWNQKDSMTTGYGTYTDEVHKLFAHYNTPDAPSWSYCPLMTSVDDILNWLNTTCFPIIENKYTPDNRFNRPTITSYLTSYPRYKYYANQNNDTYGRYYPTITLTPDRNRYDIQVRNSSNVLTHYSVRTDETNNIPPAGTYQYFTMLSDDATVSSIYETTYDISGIIFKVGKEYTGTYLTSDTYSFEQKKFADFLTENDLTGTHVTVNMTAFYDDIYVYDNNDDPTTQVDFDNFSDDEPIHNILKVYNVENITKFGKSISQIKAYISAVVAVTGSVGDKQISPIGDEYLMSCNWYYTEESDNKVLWLSSFTNVDV